MHKAGQEFRCTKKGMGKTAEREKATLHQQCETDQDLARQANCVVMYSDKHDALSALK